jgi:hypothetical protein
MNPLSDIGSTDTYQDIDAHLDELVDSMRIHLDGADPLSTATTEAFADMFGRTARHMPERVEMLFLVLARAVQRLALQETADGAAQWAIDEDQLVVANRLVLGHLDWPGATDAAVAAAAQIDSADDWYRIAEHLAGWVASLLRRDRAAAIAGIEAEIAELDAYDEK